MVSCGVPVLLNDLSLLAGLSGSGEGEPLVPGAAVADTGEGQRTNDEGGFFVGVVGGVVLRAACVVLRMSPLTASHFECAASGGVSAGLGGEVSATPRRR